MFDIAIFFHPTNTESSGATLQISNSVTFDTIALDIAIDSIDPTFPYITPLRQIMNTDTFQTYARITQTTQTSYQITMQYALFDSIQPTGPPRLVCQNATTDFMIHPPPPPPPPYIERLK